MDSPQDSLQDSPEDSPQDLLENSRKDFFEISQNLPKDSHSLDLPDSIPFPIKLNHPLTPPASAWNEYPLKPVSAQKSAAAMKALGVSLPATKPGLLQMIHKYNQDPKSDAGNRPKDHYKSRMPAWRYRIREQILPFVRHETPLLAHFQSSLRSAPLDIFLALAANLGTPEFYTLALPMGFWTGHSPQVRVILTALALGVYVAGFLKDLLCLPRPLSPPLHRITMSGSAALEYGFPSTHTTNAVSVYLILRDILAANTDTFAPHVWTALNILNLLMVASIAVGRAYCGMHGFLDILAGGVIGYAIYQATELLDPHFTLLLESGSVGNLSLIPLLILLIRIHPEPVDNCPCFDDAVAFVGVLSGVIISEYCLINHPFKGYNPPCPACVAFDYSHSGLPGALARVVLGVTLVLLWRSRAKRLLHRYLPPLFRVLSKCGLSLPRRYFTPANEYNKVPDVMPQNEELEPSQISTLFSPLRQRSTHTIRKDIVGPQSQADVFESLDFSEYQRQHLPRVEQDSLHVNSRVVVPRVRYDVEVVTKLVVYTGIPIVVIYVCSYLFVRLGI